jgi:hypothetical protein
MTSVIEAAVGAISQKLGGGFDGSAKFVIEGEGAVIVDGAGVRAATDADDADVTMTADSRHVPGDPLGRPEPHQPPSCPASSSSTATWARR